MLSEKRYVYEDRERPWTVPALIGLGVLTWIASLVFDSALSDRSGAGRGSAYMVFWLVVSALIYRGLWLGLRWAYVVSVVISVFGAFATNLYLLSDRGDARQSVWFFTLAVVELTLLFHPSTRDYFKEHKLLDAHGDEGEGSMTGRSKATDG